MEFMAFLGIAVPFVGIGVFLLFLIALMSEKSVSKGEAVRSAFQHVVSIVLLAMIVASATFLLQQGLKAWVFTKAETTRSAAMPPALYLGAEKGISGQALYACKDQCEFTATDLEQFKGWKDSYQSWKKNEGSGTYLTTAKKRDLASSTSFLIVSLPLFIWFFVFLIQREAREHQQQGSGPGPLRSSYYYFIAFIGLVGLIVSGALLVNVVMKSLLNVQDGNSATSPPTVMGASPEKYGVQSISNCAGKCEFTAEDKQLAAAWLQDYDTWQKDTYQRYPRTSSRQTDLANLIPILLVSAPLFFYHFLTIRRGSKRAAAPPTSPSAPPPASIGQH